jgi:hypothetical protein
MDDGNTFAYQKGVFMRAHFTCEAAADHVTVHLSAEGPYHPWFKQLQVTVYGAAKVRDVSVDGAPVKNWKASTAAVTIDDIPWTPAAHDVQIMYKTQ